MRTLTMVLALSAMVLAQPACAQRADPQPPQAPPPAQEPIPDKQQPDQAQPDQGDAAQNVTNIVVVAIEDLPSEVKAQAEAIVTRTTAKELAKLQNSVDASPEATSVLHANGLNSSQVVAANIDGDGTLTLIIQTTA
jgi:Flp pilus assembly protein TadD